MQYELLGELATGGMATVYLARERTRAGDDRLVAVKSIRQELASDKDFSAMFLDEAALTRRIKHPNVVPTLDVVSAEGRLLIVMEYVEGLPLAKLLELLRRRRRALPSAIAVGIAVDVLRGLHAAHELVDDERRPLSVVHRDVSPQNVMLGVDGVARLLDFGIAKAVGQQHVTAEGEIKGKLSYMPPEQQVAGPVDRRADIYATGVVLWEMLAGERLFTAADEDALVELVFAGKIDPPSLRAPEPIPVEIDRVVMRALASRPEDRWFDAARMAERLEAATPGRASPAEIAAFVTTEGKDELDRRARQIRDLDRGASAPRSVRLPAEAQAVHDALTVREHLRVASPAPKAPAREEGNRRRAERRARRRRRSVRFFVLSAVVIAILAAFALFLGMAFPVHR